MATDTVLITPAAERPTEAASATPPIQHDDRTSEERELVAWVYDMNERSERAIAEEAGFDRFDEWMETYWGPKDPAITPSYRPPIRANVIKQLILQEVSELTDGDPRIIVMKDPRKWQRDKNAELMMRSFWVRHAVNLEAMEALIWSFICPGGFVTATWDPSMLHGMGDIHVASRDPRTVKPSPYATKDDRMQYVILEDILDLPYIRQRWPDTGGAVQPEEGVSLREPERSLYRKSPSGYVGPLTAWQGASDSGAVGYQVARATVLSCFVDDTEIEEVPDILRNDAGDILAVKTRRKRKYPFGRLIQVANNRLLTRLDTSNPYRMFPVVRFQSQPSPGGFWTTSMAGEFGPLQDAANQLDSQVVENAIRLNQGYVVTDHNSGVDVENFASIPGQLVVKRQGSEFSVAYPNAMPPDMIQAGDRLRGMITRLWGFPESRMGGTHRGNVGADLTETEISQSQGITRLRARLFHRSLQRLASLIFSIMADFYKTVRPIPYLEDWEQEPAIWNPIVASDDYAIHIDPASIRPVSRSALRRQAPHMFRIGALGPKAFHEAMETPNKIEVVKELDAMAEAKAKMEMMKRAHKSSR